MQINIKETIGNNMNTNIACFTLTILNSLSIIDSEAAPANRVTIIENMINANINIIIIF